MNTRTAPQALTTHRPAAARLSAWFAHVADRWMARLQASAERRALRMLSCSTLRDIGLETRVGCDRTLARLDYERGRWQ
jgi:uncharacterized protein YjiS (DUF1127 family)